MLINGRPAHRKGDQTAHCGGKGALSEGSPNVLIGDHHAPDTARLTPTWFEFVLMDEFGNPYRDEYYCLTLPDGSERTGKLDGDGRVRIHETSAGIAKIAFPNLVCKYQMKPKASQDRT